MNELPAGWGHAVIADLIGADGLFVDGDWVETKDQDPNGDVRLTQLADVGEGYFRDSSRRFMSSARAHSLGCTFLRDGDVLVARMPDPLGRACIFPGDQMPCVTAVDVCVIRPGENAADPDWLMWWLNTPYFRREVAARQSGSTRKRISRKNLAAIRFPVPPLAEQQRIVAAIEKQFSRLDAAEASLRLAATKADRLLAQVLDDTMTVGDWVKVSDVSEVQGGIQKQPKRRPVKNRFPFLRVANVLRGRLDLTDVHEVELFGNELERLHLRAGDLLVVEGNGSVDQIGRSAVWHGEIPNCVHQNHLIRVRPGPRLDSRYMNLYWNAPQTAARISSVASSTSGLYTLSVSKIGAIPIQLPPLEEQRRIVAEVERQLSIVDATRAAIDRALERSKRLRRSILERAFTGRLVPQDPDDEPASVLLERIRAERAAQPHQRRPSRRRARMASNG